MVFFDNIHFMYFRSDSSVRKKITKLRTIDQYEIELYTTSNGYSIIDDREYKHSAGNVIIAHPGSRRQSKNYFECYAVHFNCNDEQFAKNYIDLLPHSIYLPECEEAFKELIFSNKTNEKSIELHLVSSIIKIISMLHEAFYSDIKGSTKQIVGIDNIKQINKITEYIKNNYGSDINADNLYKSEYMCRSKFFRLFKEVTGKTPGSYINTVRIENSKILLDTTELPVSAISQKCGFQSQAYFNYIFKQKIGVSPMQYRKMHF